MGARSGIEIIRKRQIIDAALAKISVSGSFNVTLEDIAREAGLSKGGIAHYYHSKEQLYKEAFGEFFGRIFQRSEETMRQCGDPLAKLLSFSWLFNWDDPDVNLGYPLLFDCMAMAARDPDYRQIFHEWVDGWIAMLREAVREGLDSGVFARLDPEETARTISSIYHGVAIRWFLDRGSHSTQWAVRASRDAITRLVLRTAD